MFMKKWLFASLLGCYITCFSCVWWRRSFHDTLQIKILQESKELEIVKVGSLNNLSNAAMYIGDENGTFEKYGIDLQFESFKGAQPMSIAVQTNEVEMWAQVLLQLVYLIF